MATKNNIPAGYKNSAVGIIPQEWEVKRLAELCQNTGDYGINAPAVPYREDLPTYLRITDIDSWGKFIKTDKASVDNPNSSQFILREGDIVFARTGATVGKTYLYDSKDGQLVFAGFLIRFTPNSNKAVPYYIKACTETASYWNWVRVISQRSGQPGINSVEYGAMKLAVPPMEEQRKIAEILGVWDEAIEKQSRLIEKLELRKRALMQRLLTGRTRLPGFTTPWQKVKLGEICKRVTRRNEGNNQNVMTISAQKGFVSQTDFFNKSVASSTLDNYHLVLKDEFCYNKSYSNGYPMGAIKRLKEADKAVVTTLYICFSIADSKRLDINFFEQFCESGGLNRGLMKVANEGGRAHGLLNVTPTDFFSLVMLLPILPEQKAIAEVLTTADNEIATHRKKLDALRLQKRGLMQQLLTGKTRVKI